MPKRDNYKFQKYKSRKTVFLKNIESENWIIKTYGIQLDRLPNNNIENFILNQLPKPAMTESRYGIGFLIIHKGVIANWIMLNWWGHEDIIHQKLFTSEDEFFQDIHPVKDKSILACVHELDIYHHESEAWKKFILMKEEPSFYDYLNAKYTV